MPFKKYLTALTLLSLLGMGVSAYLIHQHFKPSGTSFCNVNEYVNCDIVNKSEYAEISGIPVSVLGFGAYSILLVLSLAASLVRYRLPAVTTGALFSAGGLAFSIYLTGIEFFVLNAICLFCLTSQIFILFIFIIFLFLWLKRSKWRQA